MICIQSDVDDAKFHYARSCDLPTLEERIQDVAHNALVGRIGGREMEMGMLIIDNITSVASLIRTGRLKRHDLGSRGIANALISDWRVDGDVCHYDFGSQDFSCQDSVRSEVSLVLFIGGLVDIVAEYVQGRLEWQVDRLLRALQSAGWTDWTPHQLLGCLTIDTLVPFDFRCRLAAWFLQSAHWRRQMPHLDSHWLFVGQICQAVCGEDGRDLGSFRQLMATLRHYHVSLIWHHWIDVYDCLARSSVNYLVDILADEYADVCHLDCGHGDFAAVVKRMRPSVPRAMQHQSLRNRELELEQYLFRGVMPVCMLSR